jgi:hypothetical protein
MMSGAFYALRRRYGAASDNPPVEADERLSFLGTNLPQQFAAPRQHCC